jgi:endonuclease/exonuclease/phosphatase family metal-dependent hydrolase
MRRRRVLFNRSERFDMRAFFTMRGSAMRAAVPWGLACGVALLGGAPGAQPADVLPAGGVVDHRPAVEVLADWPQVQPPKTQIRLATYNVQDFLDGVDDGTNRTPEQAALHARMAARILEEISPDVLVAQEMEGAESVRLLNAQFRRPYPLAYVTDFAQQGKRPLNIAVLSRIAVEGARTIELGYMEGPGRPPRGVLSFMVPLDASRRLLVYGVHLKSNFGEAARNQAKRYHAMKVVAEDAECTRRMFPHYTWEAVVIGDTNVDPDDPQFAGDPSFEPLAGWADLWRGRPLAERVTVPTRYGDPTLEFPPCTFDRVFASPDLLEPPWVIGAPKALPKGVDTQNVFTVGGQSEVHVSDHYPVYVDIRQ